MAIFTILAGMARGEAPAGVARPTLPPLFASPSGGGRDAGDGPTALDVAAGTYAAEPAPMAAVPDDPPARRDRTTPAAGLTTQATSPTIAPSPVTPASRMTMGDVAVSSSATPVRPANAFPYRTNPSADTPAHLAQPSSVDRVGAGSTTEPKRSAPLGEQAVARRISVAREPRPVIHVTIDRIDVRAPAATHASPPAKRERPRPSRSLAEYLAGDKPGERA